MKLKYFAGACLLVSFGTGFAGHFGSTEYDMLIDGARCECNTTSTDDHSKFSACPFMKIGFFLETFDLLILLFCVFFYTIIIYKDFVSGNPCKHSCQGILLLVGGLLLLLGGILMLVSTMLPIILLKPPKQMSDTHYRFVNKMKFKHAEKVTCAIFGFLCGSLFIKIWLGVKKLAPSGQSSGGED